MQEPTMYPEWEGRRRQSTTPGAEVKRTENVRGCLSCRSSGDSTFSKGKPSNTGSLPGDRVWRSTGGPRGRDWARSGGGKACSTVEAE